MDLAPEMYEQYNYNQHIVIQAMILQQKIFGEGAEFPRVLKQMYNQRLHFLSERIKGICGVDCVKDFSAS